MKEKKELSLRVYQKILSKYQKANTRQKNIIRQKAQSGKTKKQENLSYRSKSYGMNMTKGLF